MHIHNDCVRHNSDGILTSWLQNWTVTSGPQPISFPVFSCLKAEQGRAGGTQYGIEMLHIVPRASSSTFLAWLGSGPPVQGYCSNSAAPQTWPQQTTAASTDHCGAQAEWWLSLPHQSSHSNSHSLSLTLTQTLCLTLSFLLSWCLILWCLTLHLFFGLSLALSRPKLLLAT